MRDGSWDCHRYTVAEGLRTPMFPECPRPNRQVFYIPYRGPLGMPGAAIPGDMLGQMPGGLPGMMPGLLPWVTPGVMPGGVPGPADVMFPTPRSCG